MKIAIVVVAYNREKSLERLLKSLLKVEYQNNLVDLILSIDKNENERVYSIADNFIWNYGEKKVIKHKENLGLRKHVLSCGDISKQYDAIILLEDDLFVSKVLIKYALESIKFYRNDENIAGISLYTYRLNEFAGLRPFIPLQDESDTYFIQVPSSWGVIWTKEQWEGFRKWYNQEEYDGINFTGLVPNTVLNWPESSWKKYFHMYLAHKNKFVVYPRIALSTNMGDEGTHNIVSSSAHQSVLLYNFRKGFVFKELSDKTSIKYDTFFESLNLEDINLINKETKIDYYGEKKKYLEQGLVLSTTILEYKIIKSWNLSLVPYELNVINNINGEGIYLYDLEYSCIKNNNGKNLSKRIIYEVPNITKENSMIYLLGYLKERILLKLKKLKK